MVTLTLDDLKTEKVSKAEVAVLNRVYHTNVATEEAAGESETLMNEYDSYQFLDDTGHRWYSGCWRSKLSIEF